MTTRAAAILDEARTIAVVGLSDDPSKPAHSVPATLQEHGYRVVPVNPTAEGELLGERVYASLEEVPDAIDVVQVFRPADEAPEIARHAVAKGAKAVWLQLNLQSDEARTIAEQAGLGYVENRCMAADVARFGIPRR